MAIPTKNKEKDCFRGKLYVGPEDPVNADFVKDKDWVEIRADGFVELKQKASNLCSSRFRQHDKMLLSTINHKLFPTMIPLTRCNRVIDGQIEYGIWLIT